MSPAIARCELTHLERAPIDYARAVQQHAAYESALARAGCELVQLDVEPEMPDSVFVEDCAVVARGLAVICQPGAASRRAEVDSVAAALERWMPVVRLQGTATLDGGDVLRLGRTLYVGRSARSNEEGVRQLRAAVAACAMDVVTVELRDALHLKTAVTAISDDTLLVQPRWVDSRAFAGWRVLEVDPAEPFAANTLRVASTLIVPEAHPRTAALCVPFVDEVVSVPADELAKAEGGVTCCSILVEDPEDA